MLPRGICDKVAAPAVRQLVGDYVDIFPVLLRQLPASSSLLEKRGNSHLGNQARRRKRVDGVLHATVRETRRENQDIVFTPLVRVDDPLDGLDELVRVSLELPLALGDSVGAGHDDASWADGSFGEVAGAVSSLPLLSS